MSLCNNFSTPSLIHTHTQYICTIFSRAGSIFGDINVIYKKTTPVKGINKYDSGLGLR